MYKARRCACRTWLLGTPGFFGERRSSDKEARSEFPLATCDSDLKHVSPWYQQGAWTSAYSECTQPSDAYAGCSGSRLQGSWGREGAVTRSLKLSFHQLHATQTSNRFLHTISLKLRSQPTHNVHGQATRIPDGSD